MEYAAALVAKKYNVPIQISIERYMKCGFGVCGQCCVDDTGEPMCTIGPVITGKHAFKLKEFGQYHRDKAGSIIQY
jgi:dihydroorotate dehydrogenase electron transfer subunit